MAAVGAFTSMDQAEDLKAFERRIVEHVNLLGPISTKWRMMFGSTCLVCFFSACAWILDENAKNLSFLQSLREHIVFTLSSLSVFVFLLMGAHKRIFIRSIILSRCRAVLQDFNMSCDDRGRLILKPRPAVKEYDFFNHSFYPGNG